MEQKTLSNISIGKRGNLIAGGAVITQKSPLYDRLATPNYLNPRALAGAELVNARFGQGASEKFANAITGVASRIRSEHPQAAHGKGLGKAITEYISTKMGTGPDAKNVLGSRNTNILAMFDVYTILNMGPELSVGQNYDFILTVGGARFAYPDEQSKYKSDGREEAYVAAMPAQACSAVHLVLGKEAEQLAHERKQTGDTAAWKTETAEAIRHYEEAIGFDIGNGEAIYNLSGVYSRIRQHGKAADVYKKAFECSSGKGDQAYYSSFFAESTIYTKDTGKMIVALRAIEGFYALNAQYAQAREAIDDLRAALAKILES